MKLEIYWNAKDDLISGIIAYDPNRNDCRDSYMKKDYLERRKKLEGMGCVYLDTIDLSVLAPNDTEGPYFPGEAIRILTERGCSVKELYEVIESNKKAYAKIISTAQSGLKVLDAIKAATEK
jgi:hypothetical protein